MSAITVNRKSAIDLRLVLLAGLTTALGAAVDELSGGDKYHAAYLACKDLLLLHPEPEVRDYLISEVNRIRHERSIEHKEQNS